METNVLWIPHVCKSVYKPHLGPKLKQFKENKLIFNKFQQFFFILFF